MKKLILLFLALTLTFSLWANETIPRHGLSAHIGGALSLYECDYQYRFLVKDKHAISATVGINSAAINLGFPVGINYTYGTKNQLLLGVLFLPEVLLLSFDEEVVVPYWSYWANLRIGYGREIEIFKQSVTLSIYASPVVNLIYERVGFWAGIGFTQYF